jgi:hypothetical protein
VVNVTNIPKKSQIKRKIANALKEIRREFESPITKKGTQYKSPPSGKWVTKKEWEKTQMRNSNLEYELLPSTIMLGRDAETTVGKCEATWTFDINEENGKDVRKNLHSISLVIECVRLQAGLHADSEYYPPDKPIDKDKDHPDAWVIISTSQEKLIHDRLVNNSKMPNGTDYGFGSHVEYKLDSFIDKLKKENEPLTVTLRVSEGVYWDIDFLRLEITTARKRLRSEVWWGLGLAVGAMLGWVFDICPEWLDSLRAWIHGVVPIWVIIIVVILIVFIMHLYCRFSHDP